jgi:hypothetical protein
VRRRLIALALALGVVAFGYFVWPTPWETWTHERISITPNPSWKGRFRRHRIKDPDGRWAPWPPPWDR